MQLSNPVLVFSLLAAGSKAISTTELHERLPDLPESRNTESSPRAAEASHSTFSKRYNYDEDPKDLACGCDDLKQDYTDAASKNLKDQAGSSRSSLWKRGVSMQPTAMSRPLPAPLRARISRSLSAQTS